MFLTQEKLPKLEVMLLGILASMSSNSGHKFFYRFVDTVFHQTYRVHEYLSHPQTVSTVMQILLYPNNFLFLSEDYEQQR